LGFENREPISNIQGIHKAFILDRSVRAATVADLESCNTVCKAVHGHDRSVELMDSIKQGIAKVILHGDKITGYTSGLTYFNHCRFY
jgi:hypothetical protein